jgi:uncharacterized protein
VNLTTQIGGAVNPEIEALLALQADDSAIRDIEDKRDGLAPRLAELDRVREAGVEALTRAQNALQAEDKRYMELQHRVNEHRQLHERNVAQLDLVKRMRDATAAISQVEQARRILADEESEMQATHRRLGDLRQAVETHQLALTELEREQTELRAAIAAERDALEGALADERSRRTETAGRVSRILLAKYERIRSRHRDGAVFALTGQSCGHCDTAIPMQRRNVMSQSGVIEICEACGVLLFARE